MFPAVLIDLILSYVPSKQLLPWVKKMITPALQPALWSNPNIFESGYFSRSQLPQAPIARVAQNPACADFILANLQMFRECERIWQNSAVFEEIIKCWNPEQMGTRYLQRNTHPQAIRFLKEMGMNLSCSNPFSKPHADLHVCDCHEVWGNPKAVPCLKRALQSQRRVDFRWLAANPDPWAIELFRQSSQQRDYIEEVLLANPGIFEDVDLQSLRICLAAGTR